MKPSRKPEVVYKPKSPIAKLSDEHANHLTNISSGGLMRTVVPSHVEEHFLQSGYVRHAVGGLMITQAGHHALMMWGQGR